jgi:radical SAM protein with 4Fe4S-binding SPASM domain
VPTGRAEQALQIRPGQCETVLRWLYDLSCTAPYRIKTTEAPHYRRVVLQAMAAKEGLPIADVMAGTRSGKGRFMPGMNDARGFVFISHRGDVYPSGFFPLPAGNVRKAGIETIYRDNVVFQALRRPDLLHGKCGVCGFRDICGGSRARAFATSGDVLAEDPLCAYVPPARAAV